MMMMMMMMMMMRSPSTLGAFAILFVATLAIQALATESQCYEVHIANFLPPVFRGTVASCEVNDTDLGFKTIGANQEYVYKFCGDKTHSFCRLYWGLDKAIVAYVFDAFSGTCHGTTCYYALKPDGAYYSNSYPPQALVKKYDWENISNEATKSNSGGVIVEGMCLILFALTSVIIALLS